LNDDVFLSEEKAKEYEPYYVQPFDIHLVMVAASIGKTSITPPSMLPALRNQNMWCFRNKENFPYRHTLNLIVPLVSDALKGFSSGSARDFFRKGDFQKYKIFLPPDKLLEKSENLFKGIFEMMASNIAENVSLTQTRDILLPKLISGEVSLVGLVNE
jgi:type I restriction enzyme S subunit